MKNLRVRNSALLLLFIGSLTFSCSKKKNEDPKPDDNPQTPNVNQKPATPVFNGNLANMVNDTTRVSMFKNLMNYAYSGNTKGVFVDSVRLRNMLDHNGNPYSNATLNTKKDVKISAGINPLYRDSLLHYFKRLAEASKSTENGANGQAGVILDARGQYGKLFDARGFAIDELIEKNLLGSLQLYQMFSVLLVENQITSSDKDANLKNWDMAFAYLGVPLDYGNKDYDYRIPLWGKYLKINDQKLGWNISKIINAFVAGRKAIENGNNGNVVANAKVIKDEMEKATAGMVLTSLNNVRYFNERSAPQEKNKALSQALGFLHTLANIPNRKISDTKLQEYISRLSGNNWTIPMSEVNSILAEFSGLYGFNTSVNTSL